MGYETSRAGMSIPPHFYRADAVIQDEIDRVFRRSWFGVGRADQLKTPGDFRALDIVGHAILLVRGKDGVLRAFANSCRHRGARVAEGSGNVRSFKCPFHAWVYDMDGSLKGAHQMEDQACFSRAENGLRPYRLEARYGFLFICLDDNAPTLDEQLAGFGEVHAPWPLEDLVTLRSREFEAPCNWKAFLDVFNEYYHIPFVHPNSINSVFDHPMDDDPAQAFPDKAFASQFGLTNGTGALLEDTQEAILPPIPGMEKPWADGVRYSWVFPNLTFAAGCDALWIYEAYPLTAERCHVVQTICFPKETMALPAFEENARIYMERLDAALEEDIPALENQMLGLRSPEAEAGWLHPHLEANVVAFAQWYQAKMTA